MRKTFITFIAAFAIVFASAFVFRGATDRDLNLSARELDYIAAGQEQYDFSYLKSSDIKATWEDLKAQFNDSSIAEFFDDYNLDNLWGDWNSDEFYSNIKDFFDGFNYQDMMNGNTQVNQN